VTFVFGDFDEVFSFVVPRELPSFLDTISIDTDNDLVNWVRRAIAPRIGRINLVGFREVGASIRVRVVDDPGSNIVVERPI
jgi:hypothetical protein